MKIKIVLLLILLVILPVLVSAGGSQEDTGPIKFGVSTAISGDAATYGKPFLDAIIMMADIFNDEGGILGRPVEVVYYDDKGVPDEALSVCKKLVYEDKVHVLQPGSTSGCIMTAMQVGKEAKIAQWGYGLAKDWLMQSEGMLFRAAPPDIVMIGSLADYLINERELKNIAVIHDDGFYSTTAKDVFAHWVEVLGGTITKVTVYTRGDRDFNSQIVLIKNSNPDAIFAAVHEGAGPPFLEQYLQLAGDDDIPLVGEPTWGYPDVRRQVGNLANSISGYYAHPAVKANPDPQVQEWIKVTEERLDSDFSAIMARAIVGMTVMKEAIERAGTTDGIAVMKEVHKMKDFPTLMGPFTYDPRDGEGLKTGIVLQPTAGADLSKDKVVHTVTLKEELYEENIDFTRFFGKDYYNELMEYHGF